MFCACCAAPTCSVYRAIRWKLTESLWRISVRVSSVRWGDEEEVVGGDTATFLRMLIFN